VLDRWLWEHEQPALVPFCSSGAHRRRSVTATQSEATGLVLRRRSSGRSPRPSTQKGWGEVNAGGGDANLGRKEGGGPPASLSVMGENGGGWSLYRWREKWRQWGPMSLIGEVLMWGSRGGTGAHDGSRRL
jgi:hypothetical protein